MNQDIQEHFQNIREIIREGRAGALKAVNAYALTINWQIGTYLSKQLSEAPFLQENEGSEIMLPIISTQKIVSTLSTQSQSMGSIPKILLKISWSHHAAGARFYLVSTICRVPPDVHCKSG